MEHPFSKFTSNARKEGVLAILQTSFILKRGGKDQEFAVFTKCIPPFRAQIKSLLPTFSNAIDAI